MCKLESGWVLSEIGVLGLLESFIKILSIDNSYLYEIKIWIFKFRI